MVPSGGPPSTQLSASQLFPSQVLHRSRAARLQRDPGGAAHGRLLWQRGLLLVASPPRGSDINGLVSATAPPRDGSQGMGLATNSSDTSRPPLPYASNSRLDGTGELCSSAHRARGGCGRSWGHRNTDYNTQAKQPHPSPLKMALSSRTHAGRRSLHPMLLPHPGPESTLCSSWVQYSPSQMRNQSWAKLIPPCSSKGQAVSFQD